MREPDFTLKTYRTLLEALQTHCTGFYGFAEIMAGDNFSYAVLRHDVDRKPENALELAKIEAAAGIRASYHFRRGIGSARPDIISEIVDLGHEIAYHYEDLSDACSHYKTRNKGFDRKIYLEAHESFERNLEYFRKFYPVNVVSMHGSPLSVIDNRLLWKYYDYRAKGIICEPYFDIDVSEVLYLTDTGRKWNGRKSNLRDRGRYYDPLLERDPYKEWKSKPVEGSMMKMTPEGRFLLANYAIRHTSDLISLANVNKLPGKLIINTHPQRWTDMLMPWVREYIFQNFRNSVKSLVIRK